MQVFEKEDFMNRPSGRMPNQLRKVQITREYSAHAEGSALIEYGNTKVICNATVETGVPRFLRGQGQGWVTVGNKVQSYPRFAVCEQTTFVD